jgi:hypothetical protein
VASQNAVIPPGANLFLIFLEMTGGKDARASEKLVRALLTPL